MFEEASKDISISERRKQIVDKKCAILNQGKCSMGAICPCILLGDCHSERGRYVASDRFGKSIQTLFRPIDEIFIEEMVKKDENADT